MKIECREIRKQELRIVLGPTLLRNTRKGCQEGADSPEVNGALGVHAEPEAGYRNSKLFKRAQLLRYFSVAFHALEARLV